MRLILALLIVLVALPIHADRRGILLSKKTSAAGGGGASFPADCVAFWKLNEASGTRVDHFTGNDLTDSGTVSARTGAVGDAPDFVAASFDWLERADTADLSMGANVDYSVAFWFRTDVAPAGQYPVSKDNSGGSTPEYNFRLGSGEASTAIWSHWTSGAVQKTFETTATFSSANTYHIVVTYDQSNVRIYVNGSLDSTHPNTDDCRDTASEFTLGTSLGNGGWFDGFIDEVGIWKRALSLSEAQDLQAGAQP